MRPYSVTFANNATNYTLTGDPIGGAATLVQTGTGTLTLASANTFTGTTSANNGTLNLSHSNALQHSTLAIGGGTVVFDQSVTSHAFTLGGLSGSGNLALQDNAGPPNPVTLTVGGNNASTLYSGVLSGSGGLTKIGAGALLLAGNNTYAGPTIITSGTVKLQGPAAYQYYELSVTGAQGGSIMQMSEFAIYSSGDNPANGTRVIPSGGVSANNGTWNSGEGPTNLLNNTVYQGTYLGKYCDLITPTTSAPQYVVFDFGVPLRATGYDWATANDSVPGRNPNNWTLLGSNDGTTWTTLDTETNAGQTPGSTYAYANGWSLSLPGSSASLPSGTALQLAGGATLNLGGASQTVASLSDYQGSGGSVTNSGPVAVTLTVGGPASTTFSGSIQDGANPLALTVAGTGTLTLSGSNTYSGGTTISGGVLEISSNQNLGATAGAIALDGGTLRITGAAEVDTNRATTLGPGGGTFQVANSNDGGVVLQANITGPGQLTKTGSGLLELDGANSYQGGTAINDGILLVAASGNLGSGSVTFGGSGSATLEIAGAVPSAPATPSTSMRQARSSRTIPAMPRCRA